MKQSPPTQQSVFDDKDFADKYAKRHRKMAENFGKEYADKLASRGFQKGKILDAGCGFGGTAVFLATKHPASEIVGIDLSEPLLEKANMAAETARLNERARFKKGDVQQITYGDNTFDVVLNINMVHLVKDPVKMLNELERVLVPEGILFIADIRRSWVGLFETEFRSALTLGEARELFNRSKLRDGNFSSSFLWWKFEV